MQQKTVWWHIRRHLIEQRQEKIRSNIREKEVEVTTGGPVQGVCSCNAPMSCRRGKRIPTSAHVHVERVERSELRKRKVEGPFVSPLEEFVVGADEVHDADATEKQTRHRGRHAHALQTRSLWNGSRYSHWLFVNILQPVDESRCIFAVLSAGGLTQRITWVYLACPRDPAG